MEKRNKEEEEINKSYTKFKYVGKRSTFFTEI
jgi:hypothetical protein